MIFVYKIEIIYIQKIQTNRQTTNEYTTNEYTNKNGIRNSTRYLYAEYG